jgi:hypothetical protein
MGKDHQKHGHKSSTAIVIIKSAYKDVFRSRTVTVFCTCITCSTGITTTTSTSILLALLVVLALVVLLVH